MRRSVRISANIVIDNTGNVLSLPVIVTDEGILECYLKYLIVFRYRSQSWINRSVFSVRLLIDYVDANKDVFLNPKHLFREFASCLYTGTVGEDSRDPSGLFWKPREVEDANNLIGLMTQFSDWLFNENDNTGMQLNPFRAATPYEQKLNWAAYYHKKNNSFYSHLWNVEKTKGVNSRARSVQYRQTSKFSSAFSVVKAFPKGRINDLLHDGFVLPGKESSSIIHERLNLRNILITLLMHFGGLRISEAIQLYSHDIARVNHRSVKHIVKVHHPRLGSSPVVSYKTREEYLLQKYGLKPRCDYSSSSRQFAGWKNPLLTNVKHKYFTVEFFPYNAGEMFFEFWKLYVIYQRVSAPHRSQHPYAFTSKNGDPFTIKGYEAARKKAVRKIGLKFSKADCTTAHADRHSYGQNLAENGVPPLVIKTAMHHRCIGSQSTYTQPSELELRSKLKEAEDRALKKSYFATFEDF